MRTRQSKLPEFDEELDFLEEIDVFEEDEVEPEVVRFHFCKNCGKKIPARLNFCSYECLLKLKQKVGLLGGVRVES